ncbi:hypothetical protein Sa4125_02550 [Aureimonas sp. SA4125]|uniref:Rmf/CrpP family protein n=1 Tax=Aureimonas sp. SA4125 TaxID=2826993 RepID=UPI001CC748AD|nr:Rmf/CrpP family protein [Aureimonas sp. SA4125]BDA82713.1 hypothetical protein Sa4125_02550 [Aureimonas sp. SA4125]
MRTDARDQGHLAFTSNLPMSACGYPIGSTLRAEWMEGWNSARNARPTTSTQQAAEGSSPKQSG